VHPLLAPYADRQLGLVTAAQARGIGLRGRDITYLVKCGTWTRIQRAVYAESALAVTAEVRATAVALSAPRGAVVSRDTAARLHGIDVVREQPYEHVCIRDHRANRRLLRLHCCPLEDLDVTTVAGVRVTTVSRTLLDLLRWSDRLTAIWACEDAVRKELITLTELQAIAEGVGSEPYACPIRSRVALVDPRSESPLETVIRLVLTDGGLPPPVLQHVVTDAHGTVLARLDFAYPEWCIAIEADGRAVHDQVPALYRDRQRSNVVELAGWHVLRFTWYDATMRPRYIVQTVAQALATFRPAA
jgi:hypothetical protein